MKARLYIVLCIAFITQMAGVLPLQAGHYYYKQISLKEGLPSTVRCILTDEQGFVWIGTRSGLGRFDGHELKKYIHHADDPHSLPHDLVLQIAEDEQYNIWILTDKGVARYQRQSDDFYLPTDEKGKNITAAPSPMTKPLRSLSNGMEHLSGSVSAVSAVSDVKPAIAVGQILPSVPPETIMSASQ